jgi:hypothetical protein
MRIRKKPDGRAEHDCIEKVNGLLAGRNGRLVATIPLKGGPIQLIVATEKLDQKSRKKPPVLVVTHCPFCGKKMP